MIAYLIIALIALGAFSTYTLYERHDAVNDYKTRLEQADAVMKRQADELRAETEKHIVDMEAAYEVGQQEAQRKIQVITKRGESDVAKYPVFNNPACELPNDSLHNLNAARAGLLPATDPAPPAPVLPGAVTAPERKAGNPVSTNVSGRGIVVDVPPTK